MGTNCESCPLIIIFVGYWCMSRCLYRNWCKFSFLSLHRTCDFLLSCEVGKVNKRMFSHSQHQPPRWSMIKTPVATTFDCEAKHDDTKSYLIAHETTLKSLGSDVWVPVPWSTSIGLNVVSFPFVDLSGASHTANIAWLIDQSFVSVLLPNHPEIGSTSVMVCMALWPHCSCSFFLPFVQYCKKYTRSSPNTAHVANVMKYENRNENEPLTQLISIDMNFAKQTQNSSQYSASMWQKDVKARRYWVRPCKSKDAKQVNQLPTDIFPYKCWVAWLVAKMVRATTFSNPQLEAVKLPFLTESLALLGIRKPANARAEWSVEDGVTRRPQKTKGHVPGSSPVMACMSGICANGSIWILWFWNNTASPHGSG